MTVFLRPIPILFILFSLFNFALVAQTTEKKAEIAELKKSSASYYVPYNDHGTWGWCDTLGEIMITPKFKRTNFFVAGSFHTDTPDLVAQVRTKAGVNYYSVTNGLLYPKKHGLVYNSIQFPDSISTDRYHIIQDRKGKYGLRSKKLGVILKPKFDSVQLEASWYKIVLLKKSGEPTWYRFNPEINKLLNSDITRVVDYSIQKRGQNFANSILLFQHSDGHWSKPERAGRLKPYQFDDNFIYEADVQYVHDIPAYGESYSGGDRNGAKKPDGVIKKLTFSHIPKNFLRYGFKELAVVRKDGKLGIVDETGAIYLPAVYDKILVDHNETSAELHQGEFMGLKNFFTHYPTIPAKYIDLWESKSLSVTDRWSFGVYMVRLTDNQLGYVGENAVEYFSVD